MSRAAAALALAVSLLACAAPRAGQTGANVGGPTVEDARRALDAGDSGRAAAIASDLVDHDPDDHDARWVLGWSRYRAGAFDDAAHAFDAILADRPDDDDARVGRAYADLQRGAIERAARDLADVLARRPEDDDALRGLVLASGRAPLPPDAAKAGLDAARRRLASDPGDRAWRSAALSFDAALGGAGEIRYRPDVGDGAPPAFDVRAGSGRLELRGADGVWRPTFVKGVNLGAARPGRFPTEFPEDEATYREWLDIIADLGADTVRTYTLLPPSFYRALARHNEGRERPLRLLQGVWSELPADHDFLGSEYFDGFRAEIARVIDAVHGDLGLAPRPGHAHGIYDADVSGYVLGWLLGREWESFAVVDHNAHHPGPRRWSGTWFEADGAAMECWVARAMDFAAGYEARRHGEIRPVSFVNWPTLDPLHHPTEATRAEEDRWRAHYGVPYPETLAEAPWEDDRVSLDATRIRPTEAMAAGAFASYHVYPNFPDFMNLEPAYAEARDAEGPSRYAGYLDALVAYHGDQPVLIAEFGMSTSRGVAHVQPQGWHHGGHDEREQGVLVARMLRDIHASGYAGAVVFAFMDEWFKGTWSTAPREVPQERRRMWFSAESPEQSYGLMAYRPARTGIRVDGDPTDWDADATLAARPRPSDGGWGDVIGLAAAADEGWLYLRVDTAGGPAPPDWERIGFRIAVDTLGPDAGSTRLPSPGAIDLEFGAEFVVDLGGPGESSIRVVEGYEPFAKRDHGVLMPPPAGPHRFVPLTFETNRERFGRDGTRYPAIAVDRGALRFGSLDPTSPEFDTRTDVAVGRTTGTLEIRIPWGLLNVADPSRRSVLVREDPAGPGFAGRPVDGFRVAAFAVDRSAATGHVRSALPAGGRAVTFSWATWDEPTWTFERKAGFDRIRRAMTAIPDRPSRTEDHHDR